MNTPTRLYLAGVVVAGALMAPATVLLARPDLTIGLLASTFVLLALALATELISVPLPRRGELVASTIVHVAAIFILPLPLAVLVAGGSVLAGQVLTRRRWSRVLFNVGQTVLSVGLPALLIYDPARDRHLLAPGHGWEDLPAVLFVLAAYYVLNSFFVNVAIALSEGLSPARVWWENNRTLFLPDFGMEVVGVLVAYVWQTDAVWSSLTLLPAVITIVSFRHIRRIEEEGARNADLLEETRRLNVRLSILAEAGQHFNAVLDADHVLGRVAETGAEALGDVCIVSTVDAGGSSRVRATHARADVDPALASALTQSAAGRSPDGGPRPAGGDAVVQRSLAGPTGVPAAVLEVQLRVGDRIAGVMSLARMDGRAYDDQEVQFARALADRAAAALENARLFAEVGELEATREMQRLKTDFVASVGHELRSPITLIAGYSELLTSAAMPPAQTQVMIDHIYSAALRLCRLIDDLLDISRLESGRLKLSVEPLRLDELIHEAVEQVRSVSRSHRFLASMQPGLPEAVADTVRVRQVLDNLLSNAVRYSPDGGTITVRLAQSGPETLLVSVQDEGIGIPEEARAKVFDKFYRIDTATGQKIRGLGLGLAICKQIVEAQGGRIWVDSRIGHGSAFSFTVPTAWSGVLAAPGADVAPAVA
ncbi:MAG TPA: ATP-binding protein [Chloroflexota bacterium]|nr:ATP-binding protein [Chloroflexota bacterium]